MNLRRKSRILIKVNSLTDFSNEFILIFLFSLQAYCESQTGGKCNTYLQCPSTDQCIDGRCQNHQHKSHSFDTITLTIILSSFILLFISILLTIALCILHRQRWKKDYHSPLDSSICQKSDQNDTIVPNSSNYDNVTYDAFRQNVHLSSNNNDDNDNNHHKQNIYEPKIVYLGGEQQLTAIFA